MPHPTRRLLGAVAVLGAACTQHPSLATLSHAVTDTLPGGIVHVRNPGPTAWTDTSGWKLVLERTIAPPEGSAGALGNPSHLVVDDRGGVYVLDHGPASIKHYDSAGTFLGTIGREGAGPGEYRDYGALYLVHDTLAYHDAIQSRVTLFAPGGAFVRVFPVTSRFSSSLTYVADDRGQLPLPIALMRPPDYSREGVIRYRLDGSVADSEWAPESKDAKSWNARRGKNGYGMYVPFAPQRVYVWDRAGLAAWGDQDAYRIVWSRNGTDTVRIVDVSTTATPIPARLRSDTVAALLARFEWLKGVASDGDLPSTYPLWASLMPDAAGRLWIRRPGPHGAWDRWDLLDADGRLLGAVPAPFPDDAPYYWQGDRVYVISTGRTGLPVIQVWRLDRRGTGA